MPGVCGRSCQVPKAVSPVIAILYKGRNRGSKGKAEHYLVAVGQRLETPTSLKFKDLTES